MQPITELQRRISECELCPRLRQHCQDVARVKRRAYRDWNYWGRPVPSFGDPWARLLIVGLAPGAHGANRSGRMFTGDRSGDFLYQALFDTGFASQPTSAHAADGLTLRDCYITASAHCAPPDNKPTPDELRTCRPYLEEELRLLGRVRVVVALGRVAFDSYLSAAGIRKTGVVFGHGVVQELSPVLIASYHPSQQNTSTGRLTLEMLRRVFVTARERLDPPSSTPAATAPDL